MEMVRGLRIDEYCDRYRLPVVDRVRLFVQLCHAVQHAHQKGVIHRDLKPSNILVTEQAGSPVPKIIDFGIAKATGQRLSDATVVTSLGQAIGTLAYMSPEQAEGAELDVDTRADLYSLGVILYELSWTAPPRGSRAARRPRLPRPPRRRRHRHPPTPSERLTTLGSDRTRRRDTAHRTGEAPCAVSSAAISTGSSSGQWIKIASAATRPPTLWRSTSNGI